MFSESSLQKEFKRRADKVITYIKSEIVNIRGGKVSPSLIEGLIVNTYQNTAKLKLMELATISADGTLGLLINPFDYTTIKDIEKALLSSPLNLMPKVEDKVIRLKFPPLSEERRKDLLKLVNQKIEEGKVHLRGVREEIRRQVKESFLAKEFSEDQKFRAEKEIDHLTQQFSSYLNEMEQKKKQEIMEV